MTSIDHSNDFSRSLLCIKCCTLSQNA